uniref:transporter substrate-binding domain-containing protein n=1 Tax=Vibrio parahaemolyticus TaxID=670 RepID=UPI002557B174
LSILYNSRSTLGGLVSRLNYATKPGEIKVIGPVSENQKMAVAFRKNSPELREAFDRYLDSIKKDGTYEKLVKKYYPSIYYFYNDYFLEDSKKIR